MKRTLICLCSLLLVAGALHAQSDMMIHVKSFPGSDVGTKVANAQATCPTAPLPCILVLDASLAGYNPGVMPGLCGNCSLLDYRSGTANSLLTSPTVNAYAFTSSDLVHGGNDYGAALNAAVGGQNLLNPSVVTTPTGCVKVWNTIFIDRPVTLRDVCLIPQAGGAGGVWGAAPTIINGVTLTLNTVPTGTPTAGSTTFTLPGGNCGALPSPPAGFPNYGIQLGGPGLPADEYVVSCVGGVVTLSEPAEYFVTGTASGTTSVGPVSVIGPLTTSNTLAPYAASPVAITAVNYATNTFTMASNVSAGARAIGSFMAGGTIVVGIQAEVVAPVVVFLLNVNALRDFEGQMVGGGLQNVRIQDPGANQTTSPGQTVTGVQGVQVIGWDQWTARDYVAQGLMGSALIFGGAGYGATNDGGNGTVRESYCDDCKLRDSGDRATQQSAFLIATPHGQNALSEDEINQIGCDKCQIVFSAFTSVHVLTHNPWNQVIPNGPRLIWFSGSNTQIEAGTHLNLIPNAPCADLIDLSYAKDFYVGNAELNGSDCGHGLIAIKHSALKLNVGLSRLVNRPQAINYQVNVATVGGRAQFTYVSGGHPQQTSFGNSGWNGRYVKLVDGTYCTSAVPCFYWLDPTTALVSSTLLQAPAGVPYQNSSFAGTATLTEGSGGVYLLVHAPASDGITMMLNEYNGYGSNAYDPSVAQFGQTNLNRLFLAGSGQQSEQMGCFDFPMDNSTLGGASPLGPDSLHCLGFTGQNYLSGSVLAPAAAGGVKANITGCSASSNVGGNTAGKFISGATGTCTVAIPLPTAPNGWNCNAHDVTAGTNLPFTASTTTGATLSGATTTGDVVTWSCTAF